MVCFPWANRSNEHIIILCTSFSFHFKTHTPSFNNFYTKFKFYRFLFLFKFAFIFWKNSRIFPLFEYPLDTKDFVFIFFCTCFFSSDSASLLTAFFHRFKKNCTKTVFFLSTAVRTLEVNGLFTSTLKNRITVNPTTFTNHELRPTDPPTYSFVRT